jgi:hypothetical protein
MFNTLFQVVLQPGGAMHTQGLRLSPRPLPPALTPLATVAHLTQDCQQLLTNLFSGHLIASGLVGIAIKRWARATWK